MEDIGIDEGRNGGGDKDIDRREDRGGDEGWTQKSKKYWGVGKDRVGMDGIDVNNIARLATATPPQSMTETSPKVSIPQRP